VINQIIQDGTVHADGFELINYSYQLIPSLNDDQATNFYDRIVDSGEIDLSNVDVTKRYTFNQEIDLDLHAVNSGNHVVEVVDADEKVIKTIQNVGSDNNGKLEIRGDITCLKNIDN